jgi:hypothetical protein
VKAQYCEIWILRRDQLLGQAQTSSLPFCDGPCKPVRFFESQKPINYSRTLILGGIRTAIMRPAFFSGFTAPPSGAGDISLDFVTGESILQTYKLPAVDIINTLLTVLWQSMETGVGT